MFEAHFAQRTTILSVTPFLDAREAECMFLHNKESTISHGAMSNRDTALPLTH